jgi:alkylation response protein AidB-like acyl-CoA dehydrogenase
MAVLPAAEMEILDTWHVAGLRGSGSHDVLVNEVFVPATRILAGIGTPTPSSDHMPRNSRLAYNKVGVALGIARAAIDAFVDLAGNKIPRFTSKQLRNRGFAQRAVAEAEVRLQAGRALVFELVRRMWDQAQAGQPIHREEIAMFQIACSDAVRGSIQAVDHIAQAAGTSANPLDSPLERPIRDVRVVGQHVTVAPHHIEDGGRILLGLPAQDMMLAGFN